MCKPYVYIIMNKTTGIKYIGSKTAKNAHPELFWVNYFTSSNIVKLMIESFGKDDFIYRILKVHKTKYDAQQHELKLLKRVTKRHDYANIHSGYYNNKSEEDMEELDMMQKKLASLTGKLSKENNTGIFSISDEERLLVCARAGKAAAKINKKLNRAIFNEDFRKRQHNTLREKQVSAYYDPKLRMEISSKGGKNGRFSSIYFEKNGLKEEDRIKEQSERGKRGGPKNKGFLWYNDGMNSYKYTKRMQETKSFDKFLKENENYKPGFLGNTSKGKFWANDGVCNYMVNEYDFNKRKLNKGRIGDKSKYNGHKNKKNKKK